MRRIQKTQSGQRRLGDELVKKILDTKDSE